MSKTGGCCCESAAACNSRTNRSLSARAQWGFSAVAGNDASAQLSTLDARIKEAGGAGLKEDGIFNNAYISAGADSAQNRESLASFNESFSAYYQGTKPAGRTAQFVGGCQQEGQQRGISTRAIFTE